MVVRRGRVSNARLINGLIYRRRETDSRVDRQRAAKLSSSFRTTRYTRDRTLRPVRDFMARSARSRNGIVNTDQWYVPRFFDLRVMFEYARPTIGRKRINRIASLRRARSLVNVFFHARVPRGIAQNAYILDTLRTRSRLNNRRL